MASIPFLVFTQSDLILPVDCSLVLIGCLRRIWEAAPKTDLIGPGYEAEACQHREGIADVADCEFEHGSVPFFATDEMVLDSFLWSPPHLEPLLIVYLAEGGSTSAE
jgi:hypothetical protein